MRLPRMPATCLYQPLTTHTRTHTPSQTPASTQPPNPHLQGAPYGYAPLCDGNSEMDGFRFWKTGFWREHLQGRPYHISALYVVDLERFR